MAGTANAAAGLLPGEAGRRALAIAPESWHREETPHFVLHFASHSIAAPVGVEAEFYYRVITKELGVETDPDAAVGGEEKAHLYLFETEAGWAEFIRSASLETWTGAVAIGDELFLPRYPRYRFKGNALGHEIAHLLVRRHLGEPREPGQPGHLPLWLSEGFAEEVSSRAYAAFYRARGFRAKPLVRAPATPFPLAELLKMTAYPPALRVSDFYRQSRQLVGFLRAEGGAAPFARFLRAMAGGAEVEEALQTAFGGRWASVEALEAEFAKEPGEAQPGEAPDKPEARRCSPAPGFSS